jgi:anti-sigma factor RsiW
MSGLKDILKDGKGMIPEDKLMAYLEGRLSPQEQHEVEEWLAEEGMESDALEGLRKMAPEETVQAVNKLKHHLHRQINTKKNRRQRPIKDNVWGWLAVIVILLLCIMGYVVLRYALKS